MGRHKISSLEDGMWGLWSRWEWIRFHIHIHSSILLLLSPAVSMPLQLLAWRKKSRTKSPLYNRVTMTLPAGTQGRCQVYMQGLGYAWKNLQVYQVWCHCSYDVAASFRMCLPYNYRKMTLLYPNHSSVLHLELEKYLLLRESLWIPTNTQTKPQHIPWMLSPVLPALLCGQCTSWGWRGCKYNPCLSEHQPTSLSSQ